MSSDDEHPKLFALPDRNGTTSIPKESDLYEMSLVVERAIRAFLGNGPTLEFAYVLPDGTRIKQLTLPLSSISAEQAKSIVGKFAEDCVILSQDQEKSP